jgi:hypothetical protein
MKLTKLASELRVFGDAILTLYRSPRAFARKLPDATEVAYHAVPAVVFAVSFVFFLLVAYKALVGRDYIESLKARIQPGGSPEVVIELPPDQDVLFEMNGTKLVDVGWSLDGSFSVSVSPVGNPEQNDDRYPLVSFGMGTFHAIFADLPAAAVIGEATSAILWIIYAFVISLSLYLAMRLLGGRGSLRVSLRAGILAMTYTLLPLAIVWNVVLGLILFHAPRSPDDAVPTAFFVAAPVLLLALVVLLLRSLLVVTSEVHGRRKRVVALALVLSVVPVSVISPIVLVPAIYLLSFVGSALNAVW